MDQPAVTTSELVDEPASGTTCSSHCDLVILASQHVLCSKSQQPHVADLRWAANQADSIPDSRYWCCMRTSITAYRPHNGLQLGLHVRWRLSYHQYRAAAGGYETCEVLVRCKLFESVQVWLVLASSNNGCYLRPCTIIQQKQV